MPTGNVRSENQLESDISSHIKGNIVDAQKTTAQDVRTLLGNIKRTLFYWVGELQTLISGKANASHTHNASDINAGELNPSRIPNLDASKITSGVFDIARIPAGAKETVYNYTGTQTLPHNFGLTINDVQNGDTVRINNPSNPNHLRMWIVVNDASLNQASSFVEYSAANALTLGGFSLAQVLDRTNHTGTQAQSTINGLTTDLANKADISLLNEIIENGTSYPNANENLSRKLNRTWQTLHIDCVSFRQGYCSYKTLLSEVPGEWFDNCYYATVKKCKYIESYANGIFIEISYYIKVEDCEIIECDNSMTSLGNGGGIYNSTSNYTEYRRNLIICRSTNVGTRVRPIHIHQADRGSGYLGQWRSKFVTFENNVIRYLGANGRLQVQSARSDSPNPPYKAYVSGEVIIRNNTYYGATGNRYHIVGGPGTINFSTFSSLTDNNNVPFNWEQGSVLL